VQCCSILEGLGGHDVSRLKITEKANTPNPGAFLYSMLQGATLVLIFCLFQTWCCCFDNSSKVVSLHRAVTIQIDCQSGMVIQASTTNGVALGGPFHMRLSVNGLGRGKQSCFEALTKSGLKVVRVEE